jgi:hypothetical protein
VPVTFIKLAELGIHGNGHMMMLEKNSDDVAKVITDAGKGGDPARRQAAGALSAP